MKSLLSAIFFLLALWSIVAYVLKPEPPANVRELVWVSDNNPARFEQIQIFEQMNPKRRIVLDYSHMGSKGAEKVIVQASSGVGPDIFDSYNISMLETIVEAGIAMDVRELPGAGNFAPENLWPAARDALMFSDGYWGYPANVNVSILIYNKNVFDRFGVPYPEPYKSMTWDEFVALAKSLTGDGYYGALGFGVDHIFAALHGRHYSDDGTQLLINDETHRRAFEISRDLIFKHEVQPSMLEMRTMGSQGGFGSSSGESTGSINHFAAGRFGMYLVGKYVVLPFQRSLEYQEQRLRQWEADPRGEEPELLRLGSTLLPHFPPLSPGYRLNVRATVVNQDSENKDLAAEFLSFLAGPEYSRSVNSTHDALPGNPAHANLGLGEGRPEFNVPEMHRNTVLAMEYGEAVDTSPFIFGIDVTREIDKQWSRLEASPDVSVEAILDDAQRSLERLMRRNIRRSPRLQQMWRERTGEGWQ